ncbi:hypothetical protein [Floridanema aerugineum]|uniref:Uncharacterized protein n=1 Tax=Floridaenema aerugineum BLCC-F46 TaxID=3153654 RepID=A0ABV4X729_9CYAN
MRWRSLRVARIAHFHSKVKSDRSFSTVANFGSAIAPSQLQLILRV